MMVYYYRVPVVEGGEGVRPDIEPPYSVVQYLDDGTCIVRRDDPIDSLSVLSVDDVDKLVTNPIHKTIYIGEDGYAFRPIEGVKPVGIDHDGIICLRKVEDFTVRYVDEKGNVVREEVKQRVKLIRPPFDRVLAVRDGKLVVLEKTEDNSWRLPTKTVVDEVTGEVKEVVDEDPEFPVVGGGSMRLSEVKLQFIPY